MAEKPQRRRYENATDLILARKQFQPVIHEQVQRLLNRDSDGVPLRKSSKVAIVTEKFAVDVATTWGSQLSDEQIMAVARRSSQALNWILFFKISVGCFAGYRTFKGRKTFRFPLWTPKPDTWSPRLNPYTCGDGGRYVWHGLRWASYYALYSALFAPISSLFITTSFAIELEKDPQFRSMVMNDQQNDAQPPTDQNGWGSRSQSERITDQASVYAENSISARARPGWAASRRQQNEAPQQDSLDNVLDDASPVSSTTPQDDGLDTNFSGSAWDRVRQQSRDQQGHDARNAETAYGHDRRAAGPQDRGGNESYTFSSSDEDGAAAKTVSQKEFDDLLERERRGIDQQSTSGRRS
ncbi:hypothetical protein GQ602_001452 [Ophiocordyceps camponoti-floridani]|uniref:Uncharacterized protein n=1 Tax=Ophiocordyceps camponoti-floridani TaxID=2030778 RepID=A0A8H4QE29_9HYPO|nr:hypothetical protein GQ602_001452 [Ophiocordyceps camponoti-floridani]